MKIWNRRAILAALAALVLSAAHSQEAATAFAPFPTRLRVAIKENLTILTWLDSPDIKGRYVVYRSEEALRADNFPTATRLGDIASGAQTYTDTPPDSKPYFYGVFALAEDGSPYQVFLPTKNCTAAGVSVGKAAPISATAKPASAPSVTSPSTASPSTAAPLAAAPPAATKAAGPLPAQTAAPSHSFVSALAAKPKGDAILITYKASPKSRLVLYRGTTQILGAADLLDATLVAAFVDKDGSFADFPVPGVEYYYAILGEEDLKAGRISLSAGVNSLVEPAQVRAAAISTGFAETPPASRTPPLPYFLMEDKAFGDGSALPFDEGPPPSRPVSPETEKAINALLAKAPAIQPSMPAPSTLQEELSAPSGGEDYALSLIVSDRIAARDWAGAADQLRKYLSLNRGPAASARARFYLGESLAFTGSTREAFFEFLSARERYPIETKPWIEYVLSTLHSDQ